MRNTSPRKRALKDASARACADILRLLQKALKAVRTAALDVRIRRAARTMKVSVGRRRG